MTDLNQPLADLLARFIEEQEDTSNNREVVLIVQRAFIDTLSCAYAAAGSETLTRLTRAVGAADGDGASGTVTGLALRAEDAALINAVAAHELAFDDTADAIKGHPSAVLVPAIIAIGDEIGAEGAQLIDAYCVGFQIAMAIGSGLGIIDHYSLGWHSSATIGVIAAAAAVARLRRYDAQTTRHALSLAASMAAGSVESFGTVGKPLQIGLATANAVKAANLAAAGIEVGSALLDGPKGFLALHGSAPSVEAVHEMLFGPLALATTGLHMKKYPCCSSSHPAIDMSIELAERVPIDDIERIDVTIEPGGMLALFEHRPTTGADAKFSIEHGIATALVDGFLNFGSFADDQVNRPEVQRLISLVAATESATAPFGDEGDGAKYTCLEITTRDGEVIRCRKDKADGHYDLPLSDAQLAQKARECLALSGAQELATSAIDSLWNLRNRTNPSASLLPLTRPKSTHT